MSEKLKVLQVVHGLPPHSLGGVEVATNALCVWLAERGHQVEVLAFDPSAPKEQRGEVRTEVRDGVTIFWYPKPSRRAKSRDDRPLEAAFQERLTALKPDVVHFQHLERFPKTLPEMARKAGIPTVIHLYDFWWMCPTVKLFDTDDKICSRPRAKKCLKCLTGQAPGLRNLLRYQGLRRRPDRHREILHSASLYVSVSEQTRLIHNNQFDLPPECHIVLPLRTPLPKPTGLKARGEGPLRVGFIGAVMKEKGVLPLIEAVAGSSAAMTLTLYGKPHHALEAQVSEATSKHPDKVKLHGIFQRDELTKILSEIDVLAAPSLWNETYGIIVDEALSAGIPVVATAVGGMQERIFEGRTGTLVPPGDVAALRAALERFAEDWDAATEGYDPASGLGAFDEVAERQLLHYRNLAAAQPKPPLALELDEEVGDVASFFRAQGRELSDEEVRAGLVSEIQDPASVRDAWNAADPKTIPEIEDFYKTTESYVTDLAACHATSERRIWSKVAQDILMKEPGVTRVIDYGGGAGYDTVRLADKGYEMTYYDLPSRTAAFAKHRFERRGYEIPVLSDHAGFEGPYDAAYSTEVLEHIPEPYAHLAVLAKNLRPGGLLVVTHSFELVGEDYPSHLPQNARYAEGFIDDVQSLGFEFVEERPVPGNRYFVFRRTEAPVPEALPQGKEPETSAR